MRLDASRSRDTGGSGLGLAIARSIDRGHGVRHFPRQPRGRWIVRDGLTAGSLATLTAGAASTAVAGAIYRALGWVRGGTVQVRGRYDTVTRFAELERMSGLGLTWDVRPVPLRRVGRNVGWQQVTADKAHVCSGLLESTSPTVSTHPWDKACRDMPRSENSGSRCVGARTPLGPDILQRTRIDTGPVSGGRSRIEALRVGQPKRRQAAGGLVVEDDSH